MTQLSVKSSKSLQASLVLVLFGFWLCLERYHGFFHDGTLYAMLALYKLHPVNFQNDLFVAYGSQDSFTIFSNVFAALVRLTSLDVAAFILVLVGQLAWFGALVYLVRCITRGWGFVLALACVVYCSRYYDAYLMFSYAEPFPTPRIFSEAFSLLAFSALLKRRYLLTGVSLGVALIFHPLMCLYAIAVFGITLCCDESFSRRLRLSLVWVALALAAGLVGLGVHPFDSFLRPYDAEWYRVFQSTTQTSTLPELWTTGTALRVAYLMQILCIAWWKDLPVIGKKVPLCLLVALGLIGLWAIGAWFWRDQLLIQLQLWRCVWLIQIVALIAQGVLLKGLWQEGVADRWLAGFMLAALLQVGYASPDGTYAFMMISLGLGVRWMIARLPVHLARRPLLNLLPALLPLPQLLVNILRAWNVRFLPMRSAAWPDVLQVIFWGLLGVAVTVLVGLVVWRKTGPSRRQGIGVLAGGAGCLFAAMYLWCAPFVQSDAGPTASQQRQIAQIQAYIPPDAVVYSDLDMAWVWFVLNRSNYADLRQMAGYMFSRGTALEGMRRFYHLCDAEVPGCLMKGFHVPEGATPTTFWPQHAAPLCADKALGFLVFQGEMPGAKIFAEDLANPISVFDCRRFRSD